MTRRCLPPTSWQKPSSPWQMASNRISVLCLSYFDKMVSYHFKLFYLYAQSIDTPLGPGSPPGLFQLGYIHGNMPDAHTVLLFPIRTKKASRAGSFWCDRACKPGSVLTAIYLVPQSLTGSSRLLGTIGPITCPSTALLRDRVYSTNMSPCGECALTALFHYDRKTGYISLLHLS